MTMTTKRYLKSPEYLNVGGGIEAVFFFALTLKKKSTKRVVAADKTYAAGKPNFYFDIVNVRGPCHQNAPVLARMSLQKINDQVKSGMI